VVSVVHTSKKIEKESFYELFYDESLILNGNVLILWHTKTL
jgi:hypothetical protein